jgi:hypothetical protein
VVFGLNLSALAQDSGILRVDAECRGEFIEGPIDIAYRASLALAGSVPAAASDPDDLV